MTKNIYNALRVWLINFDYHLTNSFVFNWESDYFAISKSGYVYEIEIKVTRSDFKADFNKVEKHNILKSRKGKMPNKFYYCCPIGLISPDEIPEYAGLYYFDKNRYPLISIIEIKRAKFLHKDNYLKEHWFTKKLMNKFYYKYLDLKRNKVKT